ncbi:MAG TPA: YCF48-related protein [Pyrinomonadaceae bacterium]|nr:YCF48-related protein [Pyrinomonadaceae bacterium]
MGIIRPKLLPFCVLFLAVSASGQWQKIEVGSLSWFHAVHFIDDRSGWVGGSSGSLFRTNDGGRNWRKVGLSTTDLVRDIVFFDRLKGWMLLERDRFARSGYENSSYLMRTIDGGDNWSRHEFAPGTELRARIFAGRNGRLFSLGEGGVIIELLDDGAERRIALPSKYLGLAAAFVDETRVVVAGGGGSVFASDDMGQNWRSVISGGKEAARRLNSLFFADERNGWSCGNDGIVLRTRNGGRSWQRMETGVKNDLLDIRFFKSETGFAVGSGGVILRSNDGGESWQVERNAVKHSLERLSFAGNTAIAVGYGGTVILTELRQ